MTALSINAFYKPEKVPTIRYKKFPGSVYYPTIYRKCFSDWTHYVNIYIEGKTTSDGCQDGKLYEQVCAGGKTTSKAPSLDHWIKTRNLYPVSFGGARWSYIIFKNFLHNLTPVRVWLQIMRNLKSYWKQCDIINLAQCYGKGDLAAVLGRKVNFKQHSS